MGFSVETDVPQRLLSMSYTHAVRPEEARCCLEKVQILLPELSPGFRLLTDLTQLESMDSSCSPYLIQIMDLCDERGVAMVVRVVSDPQKDIGFGIMSLFHYRSDVQIVICSNWDEAARALADGN